MFFTIINMPFLTRREKEFLDAIGVKGEYKDIAHVKLKVKPGAIDTCLTRVFKKIVEAEALKKKYRTVFKHRINIHKKRKK